jgi:GR25 family glycosyltransferase involved in LPS biosynthesis
MATLNKEYVLVKINDKRLKTQQKIQSDLSSFKRHYVECIDGHNEEAVKDFFKKNQNIKESRPMRAGYLGHWLTFLNILTYIVENNIDNLLVLEDDAILSETFIQDLEMYMSYVPEDCDFLMIYDSVPNKNNYLFNKKDVNLRVPQRVKITEDMINIHPDWDIGSKYIVRTYQRFGSVGQVFFNSGAKKIIKLTEKNGLGKSRWEGKAFDMTMYQYSFEGLINGYQPNPKHHLNKMITIEETIKGTSNETQIQLTKSVNLEKILGVDLANPK